MGNDILVCKLRTQIGGKFSRYNLGLFELKRRLISFGVEVSYPTGDTIVKTVNGMDLSFDPELSLLSFYEVECEYLKSIRKSSFHTVCNVFLNDKGYVGKSTGMELGYAMLHHIPIIFLYKPSFQTSINSMIRDLLNSKIHLFRVIRLDLLCELKVANELESISKSPVNYDLSVEAEITIMDYVRANLNDYRQ